MGKTDTLRQVDPHETAIVSGYRNNRLVGINEIMPIIEVNKEKGTYTEWGPDAKVVREGLEQPYGSRRAMIDFSVAKGDYATVKVGVDVPLYEEEVEEIADGDLQTLRDKKSTLGEDIIQLGMEKIVADYVQTAGNYAAGFTTALSGTARWDDYTNSDPFTDLSTGLDKLELSVDCEQDELAVAVGPTVWSKLRNHPKLTAALSSNDEKIVTPQFVARKLGIKELKILRGKHVISGYDFKDPRTAVFAHLWGKVALVYRPMASPSIDQPLWGFVARRKGYHRVESFNDNYLDAEIKSVKDKWGLSVRANNRAYLITTAIN